jgi:hypothetical protein
VALQEAKSIARHLGLTLRKVRSGHYRVNFRDGNETTACYTDNLEDAVNSAVHPGAASRPVNSSRRGPRAWHKPASIASLQTIAMLKPLIIATVLLLPTHGAKAAPITSSLGERCQFVLVTTSMCQ